MNGTLVCNGVFNVDDCRKVISLRQLLGVF